MTVYLDPMSRTARRAAEVARELVALRAAVPPGPMPPEHLEAINRAAAEAVADPEFLLYLIAAQATVAMACASYGGVDLAEQLALLESLAENGGTL